VSPALIASLADALPPLEGLDPVARLARLREDQRQRWLRGQRVPAEAYRLACPALGTDSETFLDLVYSEFLLRRQLGESPAVSEYVERFAPYAATLERQFAVGAALETRMPSGGEARGTVSLAVGESVSEAETTSPAKVSSVPAGVPGFEILGVLGEGGMGVVYKARQVGLNRLVALKMIRPRGLGEQALVRFHVEAEAVARLKHPNIVPVYAFGEQQGQPYFALEYVPGGSLSQRLVGGPWPPRKAAELMATLAGALHHAHERGILHRDLKPANVLLDEQGQPYLTDFGLARSMHGDSGLTLDGALMGTPQYMAPEQAQGQGHRAGPAADVFGLGAILYHLLTGRPPYEAGGNLSVLVRQASECQVTPPRRVNPRVPRTLDRICMKALSADPARRYPSAAALEQDLHRYLRRPRRMAVAGATVAGLLAVAVLAWPRNQGVPSGQAVLPSPPGASAVRAEPRPAVLSGDLTVRVWSSGARGKHGLRVQDLGALPVRTGEQVHLEARLTEPAYVYLLWVDGKGEVDALYPWGRDQDWKSPPPPAGPKQVVHSPAEVQEGWPIEGSGGLETVLLLARRTPLPADVKLAEVLGRIPPAPLGPDLGEVVMRGFDREQPSVSEDMHRRPGKQKQDIDDALLHLMGRLRPHFETIRAVQFAHQGP
jgi:serine/threonine-protein kinase